MTTDSEVSGIMRANIDGKVNLDVLSGDVREESQAQSEEQEEKRKKKSGKRKNFKKRVIFKKKSPANTLFTGLFLVHRGNPNSNPYPYLQGRWLLHQK